MAVAYIAKITFRRPCLWEPIEACYSIEVRERRRLFETEREYYQAIARELGIEAPLQTSNASLLGDFSRATVTIDETSDLMLQIGSAADRPGATHYRPLDRLSAHEQLEFAELLRSATGHPAQCSSEAP